MSDGNKKLVVDVNGEIIKVEFKNFYDDTQTKPKNHQVVHFKSEFAKLNPNYETMNTIDLFKSTDIQKFLHNPNGPAIIDVLNNKQTYFLDGNLIAEDTEEYKKIKHNEQFNGKMDKLLAE